MTVSTTQFNPRTSTPTALGIRYDWLAIAANAWLVIGLYADGWAHGNQLPDSFWTVWHAIFYSGFAASAAVVVGRTILERSPLASWRDPAAWRAAIPAGYEQSVLGVLIFGIGGLLDMTWHLIFGIESGTDALLSPTHLLLATGIALIVSGPFVAATRRQARGGLAASMPAVLSLAFLLGTFTFFTSFAGPFAGIIGSGPRPGDTVLPRAMGGVYLFSALIAGLALVALRRGSLPFGALTVILGLDAFAMIQMRGRAPIQVQVLFTLVALAAGFCADLLVLRLRPSEERLFQFRLFAMALPALFWALYITVAVLGFGSGWTAPELAGIIVEAGIVGLLMSFVSVQAGRPSNA
jgi:hypothetical protein